MKQRIQPRSILSRKSWHDGSRLGLNVDVVTLYTSSPWPSCAKTVMKCSAAAAPIADNLILMLGAVGSILKTLINMR
jgi:hypothetical protein